MKNVTFLDCSNNSNGDKLTSEQEVFQLIFLHAENQTVEAWETNDLVFDDLINHLRAGESVFISPKKVSCEKSPLSLDKDPRK